MHHLEGPQSAPGVPAHTDPRALQVEWTELGSDQVSGTKTYRLVRAGPRRIEFRASASAKLLALSLGTAGLGILVSVAVWFPSFTGLYIGGCVGLMLIFMGLVAWKIVRRPRVFDWDSGYFWVGEPGQSRGELVGSEWARLSDAIALQLLKMKPSDPPFTRDTYTYTWKSSKARAYQLNLVLKTGARHNVLHSGDLRSLRGHASAVGVFLGVPVWDATLAADPLHHR